MRATIARATVNPAPGVHGAQRARMWRDVCGGDMQSRHHEGALRGALALPEFCVENGVAPMAAKRLAAPEGGI